MLFELTKNSLRAVTDRFADSEEAEPPIRVVISKGDEDITIKVRASADAARQLFSCTLQEHQTYEDTIQGRFARLPAVTKRLGLRRRIPAQMALMRSD